MSLFLFFFNDTATTEIYTLSLHDALPIFLALTSDTFTPTQIYDYADTIIGQRLSQVEGVSQVFISGAAKEAIRVQVNPAALASAGLSMEDVRSMLGQVNVDQAKGSFDGEKVTYMLDSNDQLLRAQDYQNLILTQKVSGPIKL